jgi:hypothetical protein
MPHFRISAQFAHALLQVLSDHPAVKVLQHFQVLEMHDDPPPPRPARARAARPNDAQPAGPAQPADPAQPEVADAA